MIKAKNDDVFDGFTLGDLSGMLSADGPKLDDKDKGIPEIDPEDLEGEEEEDSSDDSKDDSGDDDIEDTEDSETGSDDDIDDEGDVDSDDTVDDDSDKTDLGEFEADISRFFMDKFADELGWSLGEDEKFGSISEVIDYIQDMVEESSKPEYASEEVQQFDEFVKSGGSLRKFYEDVVSGTVDLENVDLDSEETQRSLVREDLRNKGYNEKNITKKIERYEEAGVLADEAEDAKLSIEEFRKDKAEKLLRDQEKYNKLREQEQQKFFDDVQSYVKKLKDIRGISISEQEKKKLLDDIFKADATGQTKYQKVYAEDIARNLIESAYFTLMGDTIVNKLQRREKTNAAKDLKQKLKTSKSKRTKQKDKDQDLTVSDGLRLLSNQLM